MDYRTLRTDFEQSVEPIDQEERIGLHGMAFWEVMKSKGFFGVPPVGLFAYPQAVDAWSTQGGMVGAPPGFASISYPHSQAGPYSQGQYNNVSVLGLPQGLQKNLAPVGTVNGEVVYPHGRANGGPPFAPAPVAQISCRISQETDSEEQQVVDGRYIKKPPNAFMIYRREQRAKVVAELNKSDSATVNTVLGQRWRIMSEKDQARYYEEADKERRIHCQRFPGWTAKDNYGKKRKRIRRRTESALAAPLPENGTM